MAEQIKNKLDKISLVKTLKGACIAGGAVAILYLLEWLASLNFGSYTILATGVLSVIINFVKQWKKGN